MPDIANPYIPGQPVEDPDLFFGRRDLFDSIRDHLVRGRRAFLVSGTRRMGKTSFLNQLPLHLPEGFVPVRVELREANLQRLDRLQWRLAEAIDQQISLQLGTKPLGLEQDFFLGDPDHLLSTFCLQIRAVLEQRSLVLMLDDLARLAAGQSSLLEPLLGLLDDWRSRDPEVALLVTTSHVWQETLVRSYPRVFGGAYAQVLGHLSGEESLRLVTWPVDGIVTYDYGVARRIVEVTSGHPYYLQLICSEVINRCALAGWVNQRDLDLVVEELVAREIAEFRQVWDQSSPSEQAALAALVSLRGARGIATAQEVRTALSKAGARVSQEHVAEALESLVGRGILERLGALSYRFRVTLLRDWLGERIDLQQVVSETRWVTQGRQALAGAPSTPRLRAHARKKGSGSDSAMEPGESDDDLGEPSTRRRWPWFAAAAVLGLFLLLLMGRILLPSPTSEPDPTATLLAVATAHLPSVTQAPTRAPGLTTQPAVSASPSHTALPMSTPTLEATPTPTAPLVVARSAPSIAYQSRGPGEEQWSIYVMSSDGSNRIALQPGQASFLSAPAWSPSDAQIAFASEQGGTTDIWVMDSDGSDAVNLTQDEAKDHSPAWSPDGELLAFASVRDALYWELYTMRADGSEVRRLTWWEDASDLWPSWSPDGTRLAFASKRDGNWEIYAIDRDGSNLLRLTNDPADDTKPTWSPDGSRIAFESTRDGFAEIYVMPIVGGEAVNVSNVAWATDLGPTWSPDGGRIAFYSDRDGEWDIFVMDSGGSNVIKLTGENTNDQVPAWRP